MARWASVGVMLAVLVGACSGTSESGQVVEHQKLLEDMMNGAAEHARVDMATWSVVARPDLCGLTGKFVNVIGRTADPEADADLFVDFFERQGGTTEREGLWPRTSTPMGTFAVIAVVDGGVRVMASTSCY